MTGPELQINPKSIKTRIGETSQVRFIYVFNLLTHDFFSYNREDLEDISREIEKQEEHIRTGPLKTRSELSVEVHPLA